MKDYQVTSAELLDKAISKAKQESIIDHPRHYTQGIECADYVESHSMDFFQGNAVKYLTRFKHKGKPLEDLLKSKWYIERLIKMYSKKE